MKNTILILVAFAIIIQAHALDSIISRSSTRDSSAVAPQVTTPYQAKLLSIWSRKQSLLDSLLNNPAVALRQIYKVEKKFQAQAQLFDERIKTDDLASAATTLAELKKCRCTFEKENPIFLLGECTSEDWGACLLSRTYEPHYRNAFEQRIVASLVTKLRTLEQPVQYISFGTGGAFQDLIIFVKTLVQQPDAHIQAHFIDPRFAPLVDGLDTIGNGRTIAHNSCLDLSAKMNDFIALMRAQKNVPDDMSDSEINKYVPFRMATLEASPRQWITYLKQTFPKADISLSLHSDSDSYLAYIERNNIPCPDIIAAADIQDEMSLIRNSMSDYAKLCARISHQNSEMQNILLAKNTPNQAAFYILSAHEMPESRKESLGENPDDFVYLKEEILTAPWRCRNLLTLGCRK